VWRTTKPAQAAAEKAEISIHVLRVEDDHKLVQYVQSRAISIHVLRVEDD